MRHDSTPNILETSLAPAIRKEVAFVDTGVADWQTLADGVRPGIEVVLIDSSQGGLARMVKWAQSHSDYDAIHVLSHGSEGALRLGRDTLTWASLADAGVQAEWARLGQSLTADGDLLIYGCSVAAGETGRAFIANLAATTGADVAASDNRTGPATFNGDWGLEVASGEIEATLLESPSFAGILAQVSFTGDTGTVTDATYGGGSGPGPTSPITMTIGSDTLRIVSTGSTMYLDNETNLGDFPTGMSGKYIKTDTSSTYTTSITLSVDDGKIFDFVSMSLQESNGDADTFKFIPNGNAANAVTSSYTAVQQKLIDLSSNPNFDNLTSLTITTNDAQFQVNLDSIILDNIHLPGPTVTSVTSSTANNSYKTGDVIGIQVTFSESVTVTGTPQLTLETGDTDRTVDYVSGSPGTTLTFTYTVQAGDTSVDLDYTGTGALALNGGTINATTGGAAATLTLASPSAANSLGNAKSIVIDTSAPSISAVSIPNTPMKVGDSVTTTITVADDGGVTYTLGSSTIGGFTLGSLARTNSTTYTASFTVTEGGSDVAAGSGIPVSVVLTDNAGNSNSAYTTAISQAGDAINAHSPTDIALSNNNVATLGGVNAVVGALSSTDGSSGDTFTYTLVAGTGSTNNGLFNISGGDLRVTDPSAMSGSYSVRVRSTDAGGNWYEEAQSITVSANAAPTLTTIGSVTGGTEDTEKEITFGALQGLANEADSDGTVTAFIVKAVSTGTLKIGADAGSATAWHATTNKTIDSTHVAYWTPAANANGDLNAFTVVALDNQAVESAAPVQVVVTAAAVNDAPSVASPTINEDADSGAIAITRNAADGAEVTHYKITGIGGGTLYSDAGFTTQITGGSFIASGGATTNVYFRPTANATSAGAFTVQAATSNVDGGLGGSTATSTITLTPIADTPSVTDANTTPATQTASGLVLSRNAADSTEVTHFKITGITNGNLFKNDGTSAITNGTFITYAEGNAGLKFTPTGGGNGSFTAQAATSAADGALGGSTVNAAIAVGAAVASTTIAEDSASTTIAISQGGAETHYKITAITGGTLYSDAGLTTPITDGSFIASGGATTNVYFVPTANRNTTTGGNGSFVVQASSSAADGGLTGSQITSTVTLTPVADTPSVTDATVPAGTQSTTGLVLSRNAADGAETTHFKVTGITGGTLYKNDGTTAITNGTFITYAEGNAGLKFTPSGTGNGSFTAQAATSAADVGLGGSTVTATAAVTVPAIASATYNSTTGVLAVTGSGFLALAGATNDIDAGKFTITGEGGATYTLTDTANVEITSGTAFTLTLSSTDKAGVNALVNKAGTASTDNTVYNLAVAEDWAAGAAGAVNVADLTGNGITATLNQSPVIASNGGGASAAVSVAENATAVTTVTATDGDGDTLTFSISGGADQAKFSINAGVLSFASAPDFETPTDSDANNTYAVEVTASDGNGGTDIQTITVTVSDVSEGGGVTPPDTPPDTPPVTPPTTTAPVTVDGATVSTTTVTTATSSGTQTSTTQTVAPVTETRQEDNSTEHRTLADVPLATDSSGETLLQVSLPLGIGLTSQTISGSGASTLRDLLIAASDPKVTDTTVFGSILAHGIDAYVPSVQDEQQVTVRTITFTETTALPGQSIVVTGAQGTGESNAQHPLRQEALVVDTRNLPAGTVLTFDNVEFAIIVGAVTLTGGNGRNFVIGDGASQHIVLGADDDELHGGAGNDYVGSKGGNDKLYGDEGDDTVSGGDGDDTLDGGAGVDFMHGGKNGDTATFTGVASRYQVSYDHGKTVVRSLDDTNNVDTLVNVETLRFADQSIDVTPYATDFSWIATLYQQVLGRQADLDGFQYWAQVATPRQLHGDAALSFLRSSENGIQFDALDASAQIEYLYTELLGRPSELAGKQYWMLQHTNGMSMTEIARNFVYSVELSGRQSHGDVALNFLRSSENGIQFDTLDASAQIECLYTELLGRPSELAGREYWMLQHTNGMSMTEIAGNFVHSVELTGQYLTPTGWDFMGTPSNA